MDNEMLYNDLLSSLREAYNEADPSAQDPADHSLLQTPPTAQSTGVPHQDLMDCVRSSASLKSKVETLEKTFDELVSRAFDYFGSHPVSVRRFKGRASSMGISLKANIFDNLKTCLCNLQPQDEIVDAWLELSSLWDFLNYEFLEHVIKKFVAESNQLREDMSTYAQILEVFCSTTKVQDFFRGWPLRMKKPKEAKVNKMVVKAERSWEECTLQDIKETTNTLAHLFSLPRSLLLLRDVDQSSVSLLWYVPLFVADSIKRGVAEVKSETMSDNGFLSITIDDLQVYPLTPGNKLSRESSPAINSTGLPRQQSSQEKSPVRRVSSLTEQITPDYPLKKALPISLENTKEDVGYMEVDVQSKLPISLEAAILQIDDPEQRQKLEAIVQKAKSLSILLTGKTGSGKSTLANAIIGKIVARVGEDLQRCTTEVTKYMSTIENVAVTIWDSPGLQDGTIATHQEDYLRQMKEQCTERDLTIYCIDTSMKRFVRGDDNPDVVAMKKLTETFGIDFWKNTIIVLTFTNMIEAYHFEWRSLSPKDKAKAFNDVIQKWKDEISKVLIEDVKVPKDTESNICITLAGHYSEPHLLSQKYWISKLWFQCIAAIQTEEGKTALLKINLNRMRREEDVKDEDFKKEPEKQPLVVSNKTSSVATGCAVGAAVGSVLGPVGAFVGFAIGGFFGGLFG